MKEECVEFKEAVLGAFRVAVKVALDLQAVGESLEEQKNEELLSEFETAENEWHMGSENNDEWANAMKKRTKHFLSFNKSQSSINNEVSCVKMHLKEDQVRVGSLRGEVVRSILKNNQRKNQQKLRLNFFFLIF